MFNNWFGKDDTTDSGRSASERGVNGNSRPMERSEQLKVESPQATAPDWPERNRKPLTSPNPPAFEQIYQSATVKPPKLIYGIQKVAEMGGSAHLTGMSAPFKRKALLMALEAAGTDVGEVLNDVVARQRALKEYEEAYLEKVTQFEAAQAEQTRLQQTELDKITAQFQARIDASHDEVERWHKEFRDWQKMKQQELQRLTDAAALCVPHEAEEEDSDGKVTAIAQRAGGSYR
jgi:hypothetical protein